MGLCCVRDLGDDSTAGSAHDRMGRFLDGTVPANDYDDPRAGLVQSPGYPRGLPRLTRYPELPLDAALCEEQRHSLSRSLRPD